MAGAVLEEAKVSQELKYSINSYIQWESKVNELMNLCAIKDKVFIIRNENLLLSFTEY